MDATNYDPIADWYDERIRHGLLLHDLDVPTVLDLIDDVRGEDICDLACGQGVVARELASRGARESPAWTFPKGCWSSLGNTKKPAPWASPTSRMMPRRWIALLRKPLTASCAIWG